MASFYGNMKNNSRASFIFDKIYSSRTEMEIMMGNLPEQNTSISSFETKLEEYLGQGSKYKEILKKAVNSNNNLVGDGIFINRYILIDYNYVAETTDQNNELVEAHYVDRYNSNTLIEETEYAEHRIIDANIYGANYDHTVWMKLYIANKERYIMVAELNANPPTFELISDAPGEQNGEPHFDLRYSGELNYKYHVPKNWDFILNEYSPTSIYTNTATNEYYYYEMNNIQNEINPLQLEIDRLNQILEEASEAEEVDEELITYIENQINNLQEQIDNLLNNLNEYTTYNSNIEYPYFNKEGFLPTIHSKVPIDEEGIYLKDTQSINLYPEKEFIPIELTVDTYEKNKYYIPSGFEQVTINDENPRDENIIYYKKETIDEEDHYIAIRKTDSIDTNSSTIYYVSNGEYKKAQEDYKLPGIYYIISQKYNSENDSFYPIYKHKDDTKRLDIYLPSIGNAVSDLYDSLFGDPTRIPIGYTSTATVAEYEDGNQHQIGDDSPFSLKTLTNSQIDALSAEQIDPNVIPVYDLNRPFTPQVLYNTLNIEPYNNIQPNEPISMTWAMEILKKYISELRRLAYGANGEEGLLGYTKENDISTFNLSNDSNINAVRILTDYYELTSTQLDTIENQGYDEEHGYIIPVYRTGQGLQSDWTLNDASSFGYIHNKPKVISTTSIDIIWDACSNLI